MWLTSDLFSSLTPLLCMCAGARHALQVLLVCKDLQETHGKALKDFVVALEKDERIPEIRSRVEKFASSFAMPGFTIA